MNIKDMPYKEIILQIRLIRFLTTIHLLTHTELSYTSVNFTNYWNTLIAININTIATKEEIITKIPKKLFLP